MVPITQETCNHPGCKNLQTVSTKNHNGKKGVIFYRKWCQAHYAEKRAKNAGVSESEYARGCAERGAEAAGFATIAEHKNSKHPYRKYRKDYCENEDGSITGWPCRTQKTLFKLYPKLLQVDHIDGNPYNNDEENLQTMCCNCHTAKGEIYGDCQTPGRKTLKLVM